MPAMHAVFPSFFRQIGRRAGPAIALATALMAGGAHAQGFDFESVTRLARDRASQPYRPVSDKLPADLAQLNYDQVRDIRWRPDRALWRADKLPYEAMFFHLGLYQKEPVLINEVTPQGVRHIPYSRADFDYGKNQLRPEAWGDLGFAGFRLHNHLNSSAYKDELVVFQGASYFRALGKGQQYGLSARGLAIDTVGGRGEEFPASPSSGWCGPTRCPPRSRCTHCSTRHAPRAPTVSTSSPARRPPPRCAAAFLCAPPPATHPSPHWALRR